MEHRDVVSISEDGWSDGEREFQFSLRISSRDHARAWESPFYEEMKQNQKYSAYVINAYIDLIKQTEANDAILTNLHGFSVLFENENLEKETIVDVFGENASANNRLIIPVESEDGHWKTSTQAIRSRSQVSLIIVDEKSRTVQLIDSCKSAYTRSQEMAFFQFGKKVANAVYDGEPTIENFAVLGKC